MDPNSDTVRSMSELLKMDESYQQELQEAAEQEQNNTSHTSTTSFKSPNCPPTLDVTQVIPETMVDEHAPVSPCPSIRSQMSRTESTKVKREYKLKIFIGILFLIMVGGVTIIFQFYNRKMYLVELGYKIKFDELSRRLVIENAENDMFLYGHLGKGVPEHQLPYDCSNDKTRTTELCLLWRRNALMLIDYHSHENNYCYDIHWSSKDKEVPLNDCFSLTIGHWYGGGLMKQQSWPIKDTNIPLKPFITGTMYNNNSYGPVIEAYWLSSKGVGIFASPNQPLMVSWNQSIDGLGLGPGDQELCLSTHLSTYPNWELEENQLSWLNYTICTGENMAQVHQFMSHSYFAKPISLPGGEDLKSPIWSTSGIPAEDLNSHSVLNFTSQVVKIGFKPGKLKIDGQWEKAIGDLTFDDTRFPDASSLLQNISTQGFTTVLEICPYISSKSHAFEDAIFTSYFVKDAGGIVPGLSKIWSSDADQEIGHGIGGVIEFSNDSRLWLSDRLDELTSDINSVMFHFVGGEAEKLPHWPHFDNKYQNLNVYTRKFAETAKELSHDKSFIIRSAFRGQQFGPYIQIEESTSAEDASNTLEMVVQKALTLGVLGYPLILPPPIGGSASRTAVTPPSKEIYIRSVQLSAFFPVMQFSVLPDHYDKETLLITQDMIKFHDTFIVPKIVKCLQDPEHSLNPVIRPLWWIAPNDPTAHTISSQFLICNDTMVAPVLEVGQRTLQVYFPEGSWIDGLHNDTFVGPGWFSYQVPLNQTAYFMRLK